mmetsp:Transcript_23269/g.3822  ORF Transcript_23269/g.3822 Transcript_23269/m.3822 type:complete len:149 (+) Transcript_23269:518-964(+)
MVNNLSLLSKNCNDTVSAKLDVELVGITTFCLSGDILASPNGGGLGKVIICSNDSVSKHLIIPSEHPHASRLLTAQRVYPLFTCSSIHLSITLSAVNMHKTPSSVNVKTVPLVHATLTKFLSFISPKSTVLLVIHFTSLLALEAVHMG